LPTRGGHVSTKVPEVVARYFERDADRDIDSIVNLFADDATVVDEREEHHGTAEIHAWQTGAASKYTYTTEITSRYLAVTPAAERAPDPHGERAIALALGSLDAPLTFLELDEVFSPALRESERFRQAFSKASRSLAADGSFGAVERLLA
jgi:mannitol-1-phosphate/altronate dehydrogenase